MEIVIKAHIRAIRLFLVRLSKDDRLSEQEQWLARQTLEKLNASN